MPRRRAELEPEPERYQGTRSLKPDTFKDPQSRAVTLTQKATTQQERTQQAMRVRSRRVSPGELLPQEQSMSDEDWGNWVKQKIVNTPLPVKILAILLAGALTGGIGHAIGIHGIAGTLASHGAGEIATAEALSHLEKEISSLSKEKKLEMRLQYMSIILNFLLSRYMENIPKDKIEQELLLLINTPPTFDLNNNILNLKADLARIKKSNHKEKNKTKRKKKNKTNRKKKNKTKRKK